MRLATPLVREARLVPRQISNYEVIYPEYFDALDRFARHECSTVKTSIERLRLWSRVTRYPNCARHLCSIAPVRADQRRLYGVYSRSPKGIACFSHKSPCDLAYRMVRSVTAGQAPNCLLDYGVEPGWSGGGSQPTKLYPLSQAFFDDAGLCNPCL